jgi:hypothetical protein
MSLFRVLLLFVLVVGCRHQKSEISTSEIITESTYVQRIKELAEAAPCVRKAEFKDRRLVVTAKPDVKTCPITYLQPFLEKSKASKNYYNVFMSPRDVVLKQIGEGQTECVQEVAESDVGFKVTLKKGADVAKCSKSIGEKLGAKLLLANDVHLTYSFVSSYSCQNADASALFVRDFKNDNDFTNNLTLSYATYKNKEHSYEFHHCDLAGNQGVTSYLCVDKESRQVMEIVFAGDKIETALKTDAGGGRLKTSQILACTPETN